MVKGVVKTAFVMIEIVLSVFSIRLYKYNKYGEMLKIKNK
jgi:hypothetical protein